MWPENSRKAPQKKGTYSTEHVRDVVFSRSTNKDKVFLAKERSRHDQAQNN